MKKVLLLYPEFSPFSFWNFKEVCRLVGAKYPAPPLGLITMAALLPREWEIKLVDLNTNPLDGAQIDWSDLVFIGGMLPQQAQLLQLIDHIHARGKRVVVGGPDPTSQPHIYRKADYLVLGEVEGSIQYFLDDLERGVPSGTYLPEEKPEMIASPVPRFDLLNLKNYLMIGIQFSRGCPFNCEFCDIIELYGRKPRTKTPSQIVNELDTLYGLGYQGYVSFVDDNFIGNKEKAKEILRAVKNWSARYNHPFYFTTEVSLNLADDDELLRLMADLDFRSVFIGIESPDNAILASIHKRVNINRDIVSDLHKIYSHGIGVSGGFILGFDHETDASAQHMIDLIQQGKICMAMVGLLYALPNTQLTRRLKGERRLFPNNGEPVPHSNKVIDQLSSGINFITKRPREVVINDFISVIREVYSTRSYFDRCLRLSQILSRKAKFKPSLRKRLQYTRGFLMTVLKLGMKPSTAYYYWRNLGIILFTRKSSFEPLVNLMAMYLHFHRQSAFIVEIMCEKLYGLEVVGETEIYAQASIEQ